MKWLIEIWLKRRRLLMKFTLVDYNDISWQISMDEVHTIFEDGYSIYIIYNDKSFKSFPAAPRNKSNLPPVRLGSARTPN